MVPVAYGLRSSDPASGKRDRRSAKVGALTHTPLELINRIAAQVPPPRTHGHRKFGVLAPNLRRGWCDSSR
ncbi:MAG: transposase [Betaproteobacteria bacterium]